MNIIIFDDKSVWKSLLLFTFTRPIAEIRVGILKISEKWAHYLKAPVSFATQNHLAKKFTLHEEKQNLYINGSICPDPQLIQAILALKPHEVLKKDTLVIAHFDSYLENSEGCSVVTYDAIVVQIEYKCDIFVQNGAEIKKDFQLLTKGRVSQPITDKHTIVYGAENIFLEEGAKTKACVLNAEHGPI